MSELIIRDSDIAAVLNQEMGSGFANDVASLIARKEPGNLYDAVVSSQFDADRLDYMQRDRLMTGVQSSGIDLIWLLANLEVASIETGADEEEAGKVETLVLGPKTVQVAESYVLSLFHLYPNVYLHKTTRAAEKVFVALMTRVLRLVSEGSETKTGLPTNHPLVGFGREPSRLGSAIALDDAVFWGSLPMLAEAPDRNVAGLARRLWERRLPTCLDIRRMVEDAIPRGADQARNEHRARLALACTNILSAVRDIYAMRPDGTEVVLVDQYRREPYKRYQDSNTPLNRILIRPGSGSVADMAELSPIVASAEPYEICRIYLLDSDSAVRERIQNVARTEIQESSRGHS